MSDWRKAWLAAFKGRNEKYPALAVATAELAAKDMPPADRIAMARELLAGTDHIVVGVMHQTDGGIAAGNDAVILPSGALAWIKGSMP